MLSVDFLLHKRAKAAKEEKAFGFSDRFCELDQIFNRSPSGLYGVLSTAKSSLLRTGDLRVKSSIFSKRKSSFVFAKTKSYLAYASVIFLVKLSRAAVIWFRGQPCT